MTTPRKSVMNDQPRGNLIEDLVLRSPKSITRPALAAAGFVVRAVTMLLPIIGFIVIWFALGWITGFASQP